MKTDDLIAALATDLPARSPWRADRRVVLWMMPASILMLAIVYAMIGFRPDLVQAAVGPTFWAKAAYTIAMAAVGLWLLDRLGRPGASAKRPLLALAAVAAIVVGVVAFELSRLPRDAWMSAVMGSSSSYCVPAIAVLTLIATPFIFGAARSLAPTRPTLAGAAAGLLTGGLAATLYGLHCTESAAAFVAVWYTVGMSFGVLGGAIIGRFAFRW